VWRRQRWHGHAAAFTVASTGTDVPQVNLIDSAGDKRLLSARLRARVAPDAVHTGAIRCRLRRWDGADAGADGGKATNRLSRSRLLR
jgi:hypothetical protein